MKSWGYDKESGEKFEKLKKEAEAAKDARQYDKAIELWEQAIAVRPLDLLGNQRLAGLYLVTKQFDKAIKSLATLDKVELMDNRYAKQAAKIFKSEKKWPEAEKYAMQAIYITPYDTSAHELLRDICQGSGNTKGVQRRGTDHPDPREVDRGPEARKLTPARRAGEQAAVIPIRGPTGLTLIFLLPRDRDCELS